MSVRKLQANSLDLISSHLLQTQKVGTIIRAYQQMVTIQTLDGNHLHIVNPTLGNGPRRIVLNPYPEAVFHTFYPGMRVELSPTMVMIEARNSIDLHDTEVWTMPVVEKIKLIRKELLFFLEQLFQNTQLDQAILGEHTLTQQKLHQFFRQPSLNSITNIIGLGSGSTPLGDDALCGYILSKRFLGKSPTLIHPFVNQHFSQTTAVSQEMLLDVYHGSYSQVFIDWLRHLIHQPKLGIDQSIRGLGGHSGAMILSSFYHFTLTSLKEETYEHVFAYSR